MTIIEGDYTVSEVDTVCEHIYALNDPTISGYGIIAASEEVEEEAETEETEESEEIEIEETEDTEETEEETEESPTLFYTASDSGVNVTVIAPEGALPDGAILAVTLLDEESDEYAEAAEAVGYEDSEDTGMAALDITFYDEFGIEVEPALPVTVTVDITEIIPEGTTADTIEVTHITDTEVSTVETLVETVTDTTDETAVVVFETESFSTYMFTWYTHNGGGPNSDNKYGAVIYVSIYVDGTLASGDSLSYTVSSNNSTSLTISINDLLSAVSGMDSYTYSYATVTYSGNTYGSDSDSVTSVTSNCTTSGTGQGPNSTTYTYSSTVYTSSTSYSGLSTSTNNQEDTVYYYTINLYYVTASTATLTVNKVYKDASGNEFTADSSLSATFTATNTSTSATTTVTIAGTGSGTLSLSAGTYTISETTIPDGYTASSDVTVTVDSNGKITDSGGNEITSVTMTNVAETTVTLYINKVYVTSDGTTTTDGVSTLKATFAATPTATTTSTKTVDITGANIGELALVEGVTYTLSETAAGGYTAASSMTVEVSGGVIYVDGTAITDNDNTITVTNSPDSNHKYAGMTYAIVAIYNGRYSAMQNSTNSSSGLNGITVTVEGTTSDGVPLVYNEDEDITLWTFVATSTANVYYITDGNGHYLDIDYYSYYYTGDVTLVDYPVEITVEEGTGDKAGTVKIYTSDGALNNYSATQFSGYDNNGDNNEWLTLCLIYQPDGVYITDNIAASGELVANYVVDGVAMDLTDSSKYTIVWEKDSPEIDSEACTWTYSGSYEEVTNEEALSNLNNYAVNVALDGGALAIYKVTIYDATTGDYIGEATYTVPYADELMNCSFEYPTISSASSQQDMSNVPFWSTTTSDSLIEIGRYDGSAATYGTYNIYAGGSQAAAGDQFAELNAQNAGALYQDVLTVGGEPLYWSFYHRSRTSDGGSAYSGERTDTMYVVIMSAEDADMLLSGVSQSDQQSVLEAMITYILKNGSSADGTDGTVGTYTLASGDYAGQEVSATIWTLSSTNSYQEGEWDLNTGSYTVPDEQYLTRFFFVSGQTSSGNNTIGNLIDYATFSQDVTYVIEYWVGNYTTGEYTLYTSETGSAYPYTLVSAQYLSQFTEYGLIGSIVSNKSGGGDNPTFDSTTTTSMRVTSDTMYLSLYFSTPVVTVVKQLEGLDDVLTSIDTQTITFNIIQVDTNALAIDPLYVTVGDTGVGSNYTGVLGAGTYTISESGYKTSFSVNGTEYEWTGVTVTASSDDANLTDNGDGTYTFKLDSDTSLTITFTNTYAEVVTGGPEMPQTGGRGTKLYTTVGLLLICSGGYLLYRKLKQQKRKCNRRWNI